MYFDGNMIRPSRQSSCVNEGARHQEGQSVSEEGEKTESATRMSVEKRTLILPRISNSVGHWKGRSPSKKESTGRRKKD